MTGYELSRNWFNWAFDNKEAKTQHTALFMWIIELNNRLGWKKEFGLPTNDTMEGLSIGNKNTYLSALKDLRDWGFIKIIRESKNQYQACIISICRSENDIAQVTALDTALQQHRSQHCNGIGNGIVPINKQETNKQETNKQQANFNKSKTEAIQKQSISKTEANNNNNISFDVFYNLYDKKVDSMKTKLKWDKLNFEVQTQILSVIPEYVKATPDKQFRKSPLVYLNNKSWLDEIIKPKNTEPEKRISLVPKEDNEW